MLEIEDDVIRIEQKIKLRRKIFDYYYNFDNMIEYYAGKGYMTKFWSKHFKKVTSIEIEKDKMKDVPENCNLIYGNNKKYLDLSSNIEVIDLDAYVLPIIDEIVKYNTCKQKIIFFTWSRSNKETITNKISKHVYKEIHVERSINAHNSYYGFVRI